MERLHWVKKILEGSVKGEVLWQDRGAKRVYYIPKLQYIVILNCDASGQFWLNSAYRITEEYMRKKMESQFGS
jgi:hypothetical protein